jgi:hypothetical protein
MGAVIEFPLERRERNRRENASGPGEVVIFSGVRIDRYDTAPLERPISKRGGQALKIQQDIDER